MKFKGLVIFYLSLFSVTGFAQNKRAVLIGINNYYIKTKGKIVVDPENSLQGCVNDAKSMKQLIVSKFGFLSSNIKELYDSAASKKQILTGINNLLKQSKSGDVAVIYYSGHGMTFPYGYNTTQTAEVICPSDIFTSVNYVNDSSYQYSFIQTSELALLFNKFVDKGVILTVIFDCCYSNGTVGFKKTINTKKMINGIPKIFKYEFWEEETLMTRTTEMPKYRKGLIYMSASDNLQADVCGEQSKEDALMIWLNKNGNALANDNYSGSVTWSNNYDKNKWQKTCSIAGSTTVLFTAKDTSGHSDTTSATFTIIDTTKPSIILPAHDTIVPCCSASNIDQLKYWLINNGNAVAVDNCASINWTNNYEQLKADFEASGTVLVTFVATDACDNKNTTSATFSIDDSKNPIEYRLSLQESKSIIELLDGLNEIRDFIHHYGFFTNLWLREPLVTQVDIIDTLKKKIKLKTRYDITKNLDSIAGTQLMVTLLNNIDILLSYLSMIPYKEENFLVENNIPVSGKEQNIDKKSAYRAIEFKEFNKLKNMTNTQGFTQGFPYKEFDFNPPSQIPGSKFLFFSATNDKQKAVEKEDESGVRHGVFTKALIEVFKNKSANMNSLDVFDSIIKQFQNKKIVQAPTLRIAVSRKKQNLFGVSVNSLGR